MTNHNISERKPAALDTIKNLTVLSQEFFYTNVNVYLLITSHCISIPTSIPGFDSRLGHRISLFATALIPALRPTKPPIKWVSRALYRGLRGRNVKLNTHLHLKPRLKCVGAIPPLQRYIFMAWCFLKDRDIFTFTFMFMLITFFIGNPWNCECDALYSVYNTLTVKTGRNITLWCENPAGVRGKSWDILEEECQPRTGSTVTAVLTTDTINSTANETEMTNTSDPTANETAMPDTSDPTANETAMLDTSDPTANGTKMTDSHTTESLALNSLPKASSSTSIIFVTAFSVAVCIIIAAVFMITRKVRKPNLNHRWWEDEFTRRELLSE
jgi:hypothetical protein